MKYLDPRRDPNKWLKYVLLNLIDQDTEDSKSALKDAIAGMASWLEPGLVDQLFANWIDHYCETLDALENTQSNDDQECLLMDPVASKD